MQTSRNILCNGSAADTKLSNYFQSNKLTIDDDGRVFVDRDGKTFVAMINFLRNECLIAPAFDSEQEEKLFEIELFYWQIPYENQKLEESTVFNASLLMN